MKINVNNYIFSLCKRCLRTKIFYPIVILFICVMLILFPSAPDSKNVSATIDATAYTLALTSDPSIDLNIIVSSENTTSITKSTVTVDTASPAGYKLYISSTTDNNDLVLDTNSDKKSKYKFTPVDGTIVKPSELDTNTWGYAIPSLEGFDEEYDIEEPSTEAKFAALPKINNEILIKDHTGIADSETTDIYYAAKAGINLPSGTYSTGILYTTVSDASSEIAGEATFSPSTLTAGYDTTTATITTSLITNRVLGDIAITIGEYVCDNVIATNTQPLTLTCTMPDIAIGGTYNIAVTIPRIGKTYTIQNGLTITEEYEVKIKSNNPSFGTVSRSKIVVPNGTTFTTNGNTLKFSTGEEITATPIESIGYLTSMEWTPASGIVTEDITITANFTRTVFCEGYNRMQDIATYIPTMETGEQQQLCDARDNKLYWVAKLADDNVWMTQNLDYDIRKGENLVTTISGEEIIWNADTATTTNVADFNDISNNIKTDSYDSGNKYRPNGKGTMTDLVCTATNNGGENCHYHLGNHYKYNAATAGTGGLVVDSAATASVCPKGWRLPAGGEENYSFGYLFSKTNVTSSTILTSPLFFVYGGSVFRGSHDALNSGTYWTSYVSDAHPENLFFGLYGSLSTNDTTSIKPEGKSLRCVAIDNRQKLATITTMQEMTPDICAITKIGTTKQLIDTRDNKLYWVTKLADDNCWMTQNLDYDPVNGANIFSNNQGEEVIYTAYNTYSGKTPNYEYYDPGNTTSTNYNGETANCTVSNNSGENCHNHIGNFYTYGIVIGNTSTQILNSETTVSICPKGWRLPTDSDRYYSVKNLLVSAGGNTNLAQAPYYMKGTLVDNQGIFQGGYPFYWTSKTHAENTDFAIAYSVQEKDDSNILRNNKVSVRCVAIANQTINSITYMQEMTPSVCAKSQVNNSKQLIDSRDNKLYWVTKLADGNCWMTQNLDYHIKIGHNIIATNSGGESSWTSTESTRYTRFTSTEDDIYSYDPGEKYKPNGTGNSTSVNCTPTNNNGENCHYHQGNYYQWNAVTAGSGLHFGSLQDGNGEAAESICPKGWRLPNDVLGQSIAPQYSFKKLLEAYNIANDASGIEKLTKAPLYFTLSGSIDNTYSELGLDTLTDATIYWTSSSADTHNGTELSLYESPNIFINFKRVGATARCVAI